MNEIEDVLDALRCKEVRDILDASQGELANPATFRLVVEQGRAHVYQFLLHRRRYTSERASLLAGLVVMAKERWPEQDPAAIYPRGPTYSLAYTWQFTNEGDTPDGSAEVVWPDLETFRKLRAK